MSQPFTFVAGDAPLLISVPHDGRRLPEDMQARMTTQGLAIPDTDWHVGRLYEFAEELGASVLEADYSRYVVDLNRSPADENLYPGQVATGLCPEFTFAGDAIYAQGGVGADEVAKRVKTYWQPYHDKLRGTLDELRARHGRVVLWDAHSIASVVPRLFDGALPVLNLGTNDGTSCRGELEAELTVIVHDSGYPAVVNGRFKGGYITRHYGCPREGVDAVQLEIAQRAYMDEATGEFDESLAGRLQETLRRMLQACLQLATG